jgi:hypothetical protein
MYGDTERMSHIKRIRLPLAEGQVGQVDIGRWRSMASASDFSPQYRKRAVHRARRRKCNIYGGFTFLSSSRIWKTNALAACTFQKSKSKMLMGSSLFQNK